jgi:hypothetical protein
MAHRAWRKAPGDLSLIYAKIAFVLTLWAMRFVPCDSFSLPNA